MCEWEVIRGVTVAVASSRQTDKRDRNFLLEEVEVPNRKSSFGGATATAAVCIYDFLYLLPCRFSRQAMRQEETMVSTHTFTAGLCGNTRPTPQGPRCTCLNSSVSVSVLLTLRSAQVKSMCDCTRGAVDSHATPTGEMIFSAPSPLVYPRFDLAASFNHPYSFHDFFFNEGGRKRRNTNLPCFCLQAHIPTRAATCSDAGAAPAACSYCFHDSFGGEVASSLPLLPHFPTLWLFKDVALRLDVKPRQRLCTTTSCTNHYD